MTSPRLIGIKILTVVAVLLAALVSPTSTHAIGGPVGGFLVPAGATVSFTNADFNACNLLSWGYRLTDGQDEVQGSNVSPFPCSEVPSSDVTIGPFGSATSLLVFLTDNTCGMTYYSNGTPFDHVIVDGSNPFTLRFADAGGSCDRATTTTNNFQGYNFQVVVNIISPPDFTLSPVAPATVTVGGTATTLVTVTALNGFNQAVTLSATGAPIGMTISFGPNPVTPTSSGVQSNLNVGLLPFVPPGPTTLNVIGTAGSLVHSTPATVTVVSTVSGIGNVVNQLLANNCLSAGVSSALTAKLSAAQTALNAGDSKTTVNILSAFINQTQAQGGKNILSSCTIAGVAGDPASVLTLDAQSLIDSLTLAASPNPITGVVVSSTVSGVPGATLTMSRSDGTSVATTTTDVTGFYYFATTGLLTSGASYTVRVTGLPSGFSGSSPAYQSFTWASGAVTLSTFAAT